MNAFRTQTGKKAVLDYYDTLLQNISVPYEEINTNTRYGNTSIIAAGDKQKSPLILLHGSSMNATMWIGDINNFSEEFRVYAPDMPGEPGKSSEEQLPFESMAYVDWLHDVLKGLEITNTAVLGISLGAWLAAKFSMAYPEIVSKLILLCPAGIGSQNHEFKNIAMSLLSKGEEGVNELFAQINGGAKIPDIILNYQKLIAVAFHSRQEIIPLFSDEDLKKLTMPSLLMVGEKDIMLNSIETAERYQANVPGAKIKILPDASHSLTGLTADISDFLKY